MGMFKQGSTLNVSYILILCILNVSSLHTYTEKISKGFVVKILRWE